ncbi:GAF domain-containing protein [Scytonema sp. UIC 10036]|uniref:methyl-accepting chemotaxis protein n=1 Tax=Scytonema sp. UIC 10036 TaxID=2304196 RepID=UPI0012DA1B8F|nr:methyl-accepting chemotaxis protein [Scytonema sp. UIC 10036]MUG98524.1 GAF domain-containing protein [Scytonema sp. UIC 10036]
MSDRSHQDSQASHQKQYPRDENTALHQVKSTQRSPLNRRFGVRLLQPLRLKTKATVLAISTLSLLAIGTTAYPLANQSTGQKINQVQQTRFHGEVAVAAKGKTAPVSQQDLLLSLVIRGVLAGMVAIAIAAFLYEWGIRPILNKNNVEEKLGLEEFDTDSDREDVATLGSKINLMADKLKVLVREQSEQSRYLEAEAKRTQIFTEITLHIRQFLNQKDILQATVDAIRNSLATERVIVYSFHEDGRGTVIAESVAADFPRTISKHIDDSFSRDHYVQHYKNSRVRAIDNIHQVDITDFDKKILEQFAVKANLVAPILQEKQLVGLLIAHQCSEPRTWQKWEINLFAQLAIQVGFALDQAALLEQLEVISQEQRQQKEDLQEKLVELVTSIEAVSEGDLTVRAELTGGEIGIMADFFNFIIESLRQIVVVVKKAASEVNLAVGENSGAVQLLAFEALQQTEQMICTLEDVNQMTLSIQTVADSAQQAKAVARNAFEIARASAEAMDNTVSSILNLQQTVTETANKVNLLGEFSQEISVVVSLINKIAMQTNLLSINASLEMARIDDESRGFVVVVEEIGELAAQSAQATIEIQQILEKIKLGTSDVVQAMSTGSTQVVEGANLVKNAKLSLEQILDLSRQIDQFVQSISSATVSQAQTAGAVATLMQETAKVSQRTSDSFEIVSGSLEKTLEIAQQLQKSVSVFKTSC